MEFVTSNRQMFESLVHECGVHILNSRQLLLYLKCQSSYALSLMVLPHNLSKGTNEPATIHSPHLLSHIEVYHTGGSHFDSVLSKDLKFSLIQPKATLS